MFSVLIEVQPRKEQGDAYLAKAKMLRPEFEEAPGFIDNIRYRSLTRDGWILSLSGWRDEESVSGWHTRMRDEVEKGWNGLLADYRLRVGEVTSDTRAPGGDKVVEERAGESRVRDGTHVTLIDAKQAPEWVKANNPQEIALYLGFDLYSYGECISWDVFEGLSSPDEIVLMVTWKDARSANDHAATQIVPDDARVRVVRIVFDYAISSESARAQDHPGRSGIGMIEA
jgi:heme-degrading monooxygenase HmoA